jgi:hypothetical protein
VQRQETVDGHVARCNAGDEGVGICEQPVRVPFSTGTMTGCSLRRLQELAVQPHEDLRHLASASPQATKESEAANSPSECCSTLSFATSFGERGAGGWGRSRGGGRGSRRGSGR